jgi:uncharacterized membrane protein YqjE
MTANQRNIITGKKKIIMPMSSVELTEYLEDESLHLTIHLRKHSLDRLREIPRITERQYWSEIAKIEAELAEAGLPDVSQRNNSWMIGLVKFLFVCLGIVSSFAVLYIIFVLQEVRYDAALVMSAICVAIGTVYYGWTSYQNHLYDRLGAINSKLKILRTAELEQLGYKGEKNDQ